MCIPRRSIRKALTAVLGLALFAVASLAIADDDPPGRVARLGFLQGDVSFQPAGGDEWVQANLNRPLGTGDRLFTDNNSRVEMDVGAATLRLDAQSSFDFLNLDDNVAQTELTQGTMNVHVRRVFEGQSYEVDTPTLAFVITQPGDYRVDIAPDGTSSMVTVFSGSGDVYGENNASYSVRAGQSYKFHDSSLQDYEVLDLPRGDDFDNWVDSRNGRYEHGATRQYVSEEVIGAADLDDYGGWSDVPEYGHVWYPTTVEADWAPYRSGNWAWVDPWGWTWVDNNPWGFAPFHYGRWVYAGDRWGWSPGRIDVRPIYAPALVGFVGGAGWGIGVSTGPIGWFPLGPRDVYVPWYHTSRDYFTNVNVRNTTIINNTNITNVYNNYSRGQPINANYAYRQNARAVTAVPREAFVGARPVNAARVQVNANQLRDASVVSRVGIAPERASFAGAGARARTAPPAQVLDRRVIARTQPPPRPASVAARVEAVQRNKGEPLARQQLRQIAATPAAATATAGNRAQPQRVQLVGQNAGKPKPLPMRAAGAAQTGTAQRTPPTRGPAAVPGTPQTPNTRTAPGTTATPTTTRTPPSRTGAAQTRDQTPQRETTTPTRQQSTGNGMPSSRFAPHPGQPARSTGETRTRNGTTPNTSGRDTATVHPNTRTPPGAQTRTPASNATGNERRATTRTAPSDNNGSRIRTPSSNTTTPMEHRTPPPPRTQSTTSSQPRTESRTMQPQPSREYTPRTASPQSQPRTSPQPPARTAPPQQQRQPQTERRTTPARERPTDKKKDDNKDDNGGHR